jgi:hypothetical protein
MEALTTATSDIKDDLHDYFKFTGSTTHTEYFEESGLRFYFNSICTGIRQRERISSMDFLNNLIDTSSIKKYYNKLDELIEINPEKTWNQSKNIIYFNYEDWLNIVKDINNPPKPTEFLISAIKEYKIKYENDYDE